ncbi:E motif [Dillenia turbinata]|uniref:E motif n=1 Tax=Dillenia turbinata TaxID=194707 RepID=A0AAN8YX98_9MAGN
MSPLKQMQEAKKLHAYIITSGLHQVDHYLKKLITFFAITDPSSLDYARLLFNTIRSPSTFICNTMIRAYTLSSDPLQCLFLFAQMHQKGPPPDNYTYPFLFKACSLLSDLSRGMEIHSASLKQGFDSDLYVQNSLIHLYGSNNRIECARKVFDQMGYRDIASWTTLMACYANFHSIESARAMFDEMPERSVVTYSAMIAGYVRRNCFKEALGLFQDLLAAKMEPTDSTIMGALTACASLGDLDMGRWIYSYIRQMNNKEFDSRITTALIDLFFKCGSIESALQVFRGAKEKLVGEWTALLSGLAIHGLGEQLIGAFEDMVSSGVRPNSVTFVALLSGCTHSGLVKEGLTYFGRMKREFGVEPKIEHFGCVVDLLGRAGLINEATQIIREMPFEPNAAIWGALLNACRVYKNVEVGEIAAKWLITHESQDGATYMVLLGLYRDAERWGDVEKVKAEIKKFGCSKSPGCSLIEVNGGCHEFVAEDKSQPSALELCKSLGDAIREYGKKG